MDGESKKTKPGFTFQDMRAKARAGKLGGKQNTSDSFVSGPSTAASVSPKSVDLIRKASDKAASIPNVLEYQPRAFN